MVGRGDNGNTMLPVFLGTNRYQYDANPLPQLQLFGDCTDPFGSTIKPANYMVNEHASAENRASKRVREEQPISKLQKLRISLNNNSFQDEGGCGGSVLNPNKRVSTGLRLACEEEERNSVTSAGVNMKTALNGVLALAGGVKAEVDRQRAEFDHYIRVQEENIFMGIRELNNRHTASILDALRKRVSEKLHEKELEMENINRKNNELGERIKQFSVEAQSWHYKAKYSESVINMLKSNIQQLMAQGAAQSREGCGESEVDDAASFTKLPDFAGGPGNLPAKKHLNCKACRIKEVSILLLPCRHLCLCKDCEGFIDICPVCQVMKTASVQVYMS